MSWLFLILFSLLFIYISSRNIVTGLCILFFLLPTYLIRFSIGPLPTTLLEIMIIIIFVVWLSKKPKLPKLSPIFLIPTGLFAIGATLGIIFSLDIRNALGEWKAFYIEPILLTLVVISTINTKKKLLSIIGALLLSSLLTAAFAIVQRVTGWFVPFSFWENMDTYRVTAWYGFPNAVGLALAPIIPLALLRNELTKKDILSSTRLLTTGIVLFTIITALIFAKSTGAIIGVAAGLIVYALVKKQTRVWTLLLLFIGSISFMILPMHNPIKQELLLQDRSGQIRISMWSEAIELLKDNPIKGTGLASYDKKIEPYHTTVNNEGIEIFHHPHNIFLTMWANIGIVGLLGFVLLIIWFIFQSYKTKQAHLLLPILATVLVMGLVDSPYIKNDLAILFWFLLSLPILFSSYDITRNSQNA